MVNEAKKIAPADAPQASLRIFSDPEEGLRLVKAFAQIEDARMRRALITLAKSLSRAGSGLSIQAVWPALDPMKDLDDRFCS